MKYLFGVIEEYAKEQIHTPKSERKYNTNNLLDLVAEAKEGHDDKNHTQEFYDTLERIVNELRGWTEHSTAFLQRVRKTEVIDYYDVIKNPMDLGTVLKKVKAQQYKAKKEFHDDLELIWHNCWTYNSAPNHPLRRSAQLLQQRANQSLEFVSEFAVPQSHPRKERLESEVEVESGDGSRSRLQSIQPENSVNSPANDLRSRAKSSTPSRFAFASSTNTEIYPRSVSAMTQFQNILGSDDHATSSKVTLEEWYSALKNENLLSSGVPHMDFKQSSLKRASQGDTGTNPSKKIKKARVFPPKVGLGIRMNSNIKTLRQVRTLHKEVSKTALSQNINAEDNDTVHLLNENSSGDERLLKQKAPNFRHPPPEIYNTTVAADAGQETLRHISCMMAEHVGFESSTLTALEVLANTAAEHIMNSGRLVKTFSERFGNVYTPEEIIHHFINLSGNDYPLRLESYIKDDIERHGNKLSDVLRKLQQVRQDQIDGLTAKTLGDEEFFARDGEAMVLGGISGELGDDFFGMRSIGLDKELGIETLSIPKRLFYGESRQIDPSRTTNSLSKKSNRVTLPPPFVPLDEASIEHQIGLLQPFYRARVGTDVRLIEDDKLTTRPKVFRPKVPPTGKIIVKRKALETSGNVPKKRLGRPPKIRDPPASSAPNGTNNNSIATSAIAPAKVVAIQPSNTSLT